jgi:hypothetical protein
MRVFSAICILMLTELSIPLHADQDFCGGIHNTAFQAGEVLKYKVMYSLARVNVGAGEAMFTTTLERLKFLR